MAVFIGGPLDRKQQHLAPHIVQSGRYEVMEQPQLPALAVLDGTVPDELVINVQIYTQRFIYGTEVWVHREMTDQQARRQLFSKGVMAFALKSYVTEGG